ncbi:MAG: glycine--tRNA ligase subunit beta [Deltaproteobacteria bacterium]|nr:glycine--tRNA ligase subunit beta [Deltaproteobacteria bacterium]
MKPLLIEIVSEEIPAGYIDPALEAMKNLMGQKLSQARVEYGAMETFGTPRRLALMVQEVSERQASVTREVVGPPKSAAFDAEGRPTRAAEGFAKGQGVSMKRLTIKKTAKGEYVCVKKLERGQASWRLLQSVIPELIMAIPFPKSMRWSDLSLVFTRPIHGVLALFGDRIIPFKMENIRSGRRTFGHRFMHPGRISISEVSDYVPALRSAFVLADVEERKHAIQEEITRAARKLGGEVISDNDLLDTVTHLVEYPAVSAGTFDKGFLEVPREVLITAMREHQKYFAVAGSDQQLLPCFIAVNNTPVEDIALVTAGHERVLRARLSDARFFFETDSKTPPHEIVERLNGVLFQAKLGTMFEKVCRVQKLAEHLADLTAPDLKASVSRGAWLCKSDLTTQMVNEFPKLQGVMGRIYAAQAGEPEAAAQAIEEHYLPAYAGGRLPATVPGSLVSIADKLDTVCGCFGVGLIPSGTSDPYALRRQTIGIIQIILTQAFSFSLKGLIEKSLELVHDKISGDTEQLVVQVLTFFQHRMEHLLAEEGFSKDVITAVVSASMEDLPAVRKRTEALEALKAEPDFQPLAIAFKRVANIIRQAKERGEIVSGGLDAPAKTDPGLFQESCEQALFDALKKVKHDMSEDLKSGAFDRALLTVSTLKGPVDDFFDGVMVLTEDERLKQNRLALLGEIADLFNVFADFSRIST